MEVKDNSNTELLKKLGVSPFQQRLPWLGGDLQTLRDTFRKDNLPKDIGEPIKVSVPSLPNSSDCEGYLLAFLDRPSRLERIRGLVLMLHGLGGSSRRSGLRRMAYSLTVAGFAVLRVNLRGSDPCRHLVSGTYAANCNTDLGPVVIRARKLCEELSKNHLTSKSRLPLLGAGISLGGTILLNACLDKRLTSKNDEPLLDGLICASSPLDLAACSRSIEKPRNLLYQKWLLQRLVRQTLSDPFGIKPDELRYLKDTQKKIGPSNTIRDFDSFITAPRWGYKNVDDYYLKASPLQNILNNPICLPPTLFLQAEDDPWVPAKGAKDLKESIYNKKTQPIEVLLTSHGGHNGFHGETGCWGDELVQNWFKGLGY